MADGIELKITGVNEQITRNVDVMHILTSIKMTPAVRNIARVWGNNFVSEGGSVGGWRELAPATQDLRASRGYDPQHPILVQTGALQRAAWLRLAVNSGESLSVSGEGVSMNYSARFNTANLSISGTKVTNQFRSQNRRRGSRIYSQPPRRFWFVDAAVVEAAKKGILESIQEDVRGL